MAACIDGGEAYGNVKGTSVNTILALSLLAPEDSSDPDKARCVLPRLRVRRQCPARRLRIGHGEDVELIALKPQLDHVYAREHNEHRFLAQLARRRGHERVVLVTQAFGLEGVGRHYELA